MEPHRRSLNALFAVCLLALVGTPAFATDFVVTKTTDSADGSCNADCSLREAIIAANASPGADRIILGSGLTYTLTLGPADPTGAIVPGSGDLDVTDALTIAGNGSSIDAALLDRVLDIQGSFTVTINNLTIKNGFASGFLSLGGGLNIRGATVVLNNCVITGNSTAVESGARDGGGGIAVVGSYSTPGGLATLASLSLVNSTVSGNSGLNGGGILCVLCSLTITGSTIAGNTASGRDGGGIDMVGNASALSMNGGALVSNSVTGASSQGGGLSVPFGTSVSTLDRSRIVANAATTGGAVFESVGMTTATNDWWGCSFGPGTGGSGCVGTPNGVAGSVTSAPFLILAATALPASISPGSSSIVTANLTLNSVNTDTSAGGTVPNGIVAAFAGTLGTFATPTATTTSGKATDFFTNSGGAGLASVNATVDGQTTSATLTVVGAPTVITGAAWGIGASSATLNGTANPNGAAAIGQFQYGPTTAYGSVTPAQGLGGGTSQVAIGGGALTGLACGTLYHFRGTATNVGGTTNGLDATFTTRSCLPTVTGDFDGDRRADPTVFRPGTGYWYTLQSASNYSTYLAQQWGVGTDILVPGDYDGDGKTDLAIFRPSTATWWILQSSTNYTTYVSHQWGEPTDTPVPGDYDGDGKTDVAIFRPSTGTWWILQSSTNYTTYVSHQWGEPTDTPVPGDYDGDGKTDVAIFRPSTATWWILESNTNHTTYGSHQWGEPTDIPVPGDYDGDGKTDVAISGPQRPRGGSCSRAPTTPPTAPTSGGADRHARTARLRWRRQDRRGDLPALNGHVVDPAVRHRLHDLRLAPVGERRRHPRVQGAVRRMSWGAW